jgi:PAS domain S-box-containing protein
MENAHLTKLQKEAITAKQTDSFNKKLETLQHAFSLFSKETSRLEKAYQSLQKQFKEKLIELDDTNQYLNSLVSNITQGMIFINTLGVITTFNPSAERILEISSSKVLNENFWTVFEDHCFGFSIKEAITNHTSPEIEYTRWQEKKELEISCSSIQKENDHYQGLIVLIRDITKLKKFQVLATRNERMKELGEMAASVAHEIRNPLGGIKGFASLLQRDLDSLPKAQKMANAIIEGTNTLDRLVSKVLHYSRPLSLQLETILIDPFLTEIVDLVTADSQWKKMITLKVKISNKKLKLLCDKGLLHSVFLNLILNSAQAITKKGTILLSAEEHNDYITLQIKDSGIGIKKEDIEKIFSPFFTTKVYGTGVGLAEVHKIIQAHGGVVEVQSEENKGTVFILKLPLKQT